VRPRLADELAGEEAAVPRVAEDVTCQVVGGEEVDLRADVAGGGAGSGPENSAGLVVDRVAIRRSPEEVLLEGQREIVDRADGESRIRADDVLPADVVDVAEEGMG